MHGNAGLTGTLPANLPWPKLRSLKLGGASVGGSVPSAWCTAPFAKHLYSLELNGSAADPALPSCAEHAMVAAAALAVLLPAVALLGVGFAARVLWRRRLRRQLDARLGKGGGQQEEARGLIGGESAAVGGSSREGSSISWESGRRARMNRLLSAQLGPNGLLSVPLEAAPAALAHQLPTLAEDEGAHEAGAHGAPASVTSRDIELGQRRGLSTHLRQAAGSRRWALGTASMQLHVQPGELEFCKDDQGRLVVLGLSTHAVVYKAWLHGGEPVAAKVFELLPGMDSRAAWHEAALLRECIHDRIVPLYGVAIKGLLLILVTRLMEGGSLTTALQIQEQREVLRWQAGGRQRDARAARRPSNVLLTGSLRAGVGDLGVAQTVGSRARTAGGFCCTHAAPEQLMGSAAASPPTSTPWASS
ncbi:Serine threonine-kinase CTR1 [Micractinium conductrix]|uniref:Serine threonine-kinase CTR1 n=1 Tax=Micractinium conductrix TaxID=554055 RepID=A0A2P6VMM0_9CHLO|nr:Serine threonine-kinase CTR1 [Micractinium conductrix]|eukprot:PSC75307.1 Serine threonine-kinase CTR1 [Micractinium conductrix]